MGVGLRTKSMQTEGPMRGRGKREMHVMFSLWGLVSTAVATKAKEKEQSGGHDSSKHTTQG